MNYGLYLFKNINPSTRLEIHRRGWSGEPNEITAMGSVYLRGLDNSDPLATIIKSSLDIEIKDLGEIDYREFFTADAKKFKVLVTENGAQVWGGYITPDSYSQAYEYRTSINLIARDNLGMLDQLDYDWFDNLFITPVALVVKAQERIGWLMEPIEWYVQQYVSGSGVAVKDAYLNVELFREKTWWEVLEIVLSSLGQQLRYVGNNRVVICPSADLHRIGEIGGNNEITHAVDSAATMEIIPSWKQLDIKQDYGKLKGYTLSRADESDYIFSERKVWDSVIGGVYGGAYYYMGNQWTNSSASNPVLFINPHSRRPMFNVGKIDTSALYLTALNQTNDEKTDPYIYKHVYVSDVKAQLSIKVKVENRLLAAQTDYKNEDRLSVHHPRSLSYEWDFRCKLIFVDNSGKTYYFNSNSWSVKANEIEIFKFRSQFGRNVEMKDNDFIINLESLPATIGDLMFCVLPINCINPLGAADHYAVAKIKTFEITTDVETSGRDLKGKINPDGNVKESVDIVVGEVPVNSGDYLTYAGGLFDGSEYHKALTGWHRADNKGGVRPLSELIGRGRAHQFSAFRNVNGERTGGKAIRLKTQMSSTLGFGQLFKVNEDNFILSSCTYDICQKMADIELLQSLPYEHQEGTYEENAVSGGGGAVIGGGKSDIVVWGTENGGVITTKRTYELPMQQSPSGAYVLADRPGDPTATKIPVADLMLKSHAATHAMGADDQITPASIGAATEKHDHDKTYSKLDHNHDETYAKTNHLHDDRYSQKDHHHDGRYAKVNGDLTADFSGKVITANEKTTAPRFETPSFDPDPFGLGGALTEDPDTQESTLTVHNVVAKNGITAPVFTARIMEATGGMDITSAATAKLTNVADGGSHWQCFYKCAGQLWKPLDQARIQSEFGGFLWGLVTAVSEQPNAKGEYWFNISKTTVADGSNVAPKIDDTVVLYGHRGADKYRQSLFIKSCGVDNPGEDYEPYEAKYVAINSFSLPKSKCTKWDGLTFDIAVNRFTIMGRDGNLYRQPNDRGAWADISTAQGARVCYEFDRVAHDGSIWQCVAAQTTDTPSGASVAWVCVVPKGESGKNGTNGLNGANGKDGLSVIWKGDLPNPPVDPQVNWTYRDTDNGVVYIYNGTAWEMMVADGNDGAQGTMGADGLSVFITYHDAPITSKPAKPTAGGTTSGWHTAPSSSCVWMSQKVAASSTSGSWGEPIQIQGDKGDKGDRGLQGLQGAQGLQGIAGPKGTDGLTSYFHIKYAPVAAPTAAQMTEIPSTFIGTYVDTVAADSADPQKYIWARFEGLQGASGTNGIPGTNGTNGQTSYLHIKYSNDGGATFTASQGEVSGDWIGQYTDFTQADSTTTSHYTWSKVKGESGVDGLDGSSPVIYSLLPSATAARKDKAGVVSPATVSCQVELRVGNEREIIGVDAPIDFAGRNLLLNSYPSNLYHWNPNMAGSKVDLTTFGRPVFLLGSASYTGFYQPMPSVLPNGKIVVSYDVWTDTATTLRAGHQDGSPLVDMVVDRLNEWHRITLEQTVKVSGPFVLYRIGSVAAGAKTYIKDITVTKVGGNLWSPAPEDYAIQRNGEAYTAGASVNPTDTINWSLHDPSKATQAEPIDRSATTLVEDGKDAPKLIVQFSVDGSTKWHDAYVAADRYRRESNDGGTTWGKALRMWGETGSAGADGKKTPYTDFSYGYGLSQPTTWSDAPPTKVDEQHLWERIQKYTPKADNSGWTLSSTSYAIIGEYIEVGGVNLALKSDKKIQNNAYLMGTINLSRDLVDDEVLTISVDATIDPSQRIYVALHPSSASLAFVSKGSDGLYTAIFSFKKHPNYPNDIRNTIRLYNYPHTGNLTGYISRVMLTRGNRATDWSPAPQDVQGEIDSAKAAAEAAKAEALAVETRTKAYADGKVTASETYAIQMAEQYATAAKEAAQLAAAVYADGIITEAEARALADATAKAAAAKEAAIEAANQAAAAAEAAAKAEAVQRQNDLAASIGYASWADLEATAATGQTIIEGGRINTELIETAALVAKLLHADSGFIDKLTVNSLMTPGREVEINATRAKFGAAEVQGDGSVAIKNTSGDEITKLVRGEIDDLDTILGKNQNTGDVAIPQLGGNGDLRPTGGSWENPQWTERATAAAVTAAYDGTTITIKGASMSLGAGLYVPGTYVQIRIKAELRNALGGSWLIAEQAAQYYYDYPERNTTIPLARTFTGMPKGAYRLVISAVIQSWNGDWTTAGQLAASFGGGGGTMSAVFTNAANQSILGRGLSVMRSATEFLHLGWDKALGAVGGRKWGLTYRGAMDIPGVLAQYKVSSNGTIFNASRFGAKAHPSAHAGHPSSGVFTIPHEIGHTNYSVSVAFEKFSGFWSVQEMAAKSVTIYISNHQNSAYADPNFYITITGNN